MASIVLSERRLLVIDLTGRGFGFVVFEGPDNPVDWAVKQSGPQAGDRTTDQVKRLCQLYRPDIVVLKELEDSSNGNHRRVILTRTIVELVGTLKIKSQFVSWARVRTHFGGRTTPTKHDIAGRVADRLPALAPRMPRIRKPWMAEYYRMAIFEAAALGIVYYATRLGRQHQPAYESGD